MARGLALTTTMAAAALLVVLLLATAPAGAMNFGEHDLASDDSLRELYERYAQPPHGRPAGRPAAGRGAGAGGRAPCTSASMTWRRTTPCELCTSAACSHRTAAQLVVLLLAAMTRRSFGRDEQQLHVMGNGDREDGKVRSLELQQDRLP
ncbi:hypothetical protein ACQ4PT_023988 [Festuca glaucescens]